MTLEDLITTVIPISANIEYNTMILTNAVDIYYNWEKIYNKHISSVNKSTKSTKTAQEF